mmetsp:Transcript_67960/g.198863  ORF Transcript_67960/g.198863 Transcript_67960/m.198863 type:complete len:244 (+) Transcript_67960:91-822(+)
MDKDNPKTVVCFGDSNTWGASGRLKEQGCRLPYAARWTTQLQRRLGDGTVVVPEGLNGRTTVMDDPHNWMISGAVSFGDGANGRRYLLPCLFSHKPVDLVVLALGCNDLKMRFALSPMEIAQGCKLLIRDIRTSGCGPDGAPPQVLLVSPPLVRLTDVHPGFGPERERRSAGAIAAYRELAEEEGVGFVNLTDVPTSEDGLHFDQAGAAMIGEKVAEKAAALLGLQVLGEEAGPPAKRLRADA